MAGFDAVFVGSGINSLAGAALLAKDGWRVCVLERNDWLGGAIKTVDGLTAPGFRHEVFSSWHPLWVGSPAYAELKPDLDRLGLEYLNTDLPTATAFPDGSSAHLSTDGAANAAELGDAWQRQFDEFMAAADIAFGALGTELWSTQGLSLGRKAYKQFGRRGLVEFAGHSLLSARDWLHETFPDERAHGLLAPWVLHTGLGPDQAMSGLHDAGDRLRAPARRDAGAEGRRREPRRRARDDRARRGRRAAHRGRRRADPRVGGQGDRRPPRRRRDDLRVAAPCSPASRRRSSTAACSARPTRRRGSATQALRFRYGRGEMQIHIAMNELPRWRGDERLARTPLVHLTPGLDGVSRAVNEADRGLLPAEATIVLGQPMTVDPSRAPDGSWVIWVQLQELPPRAEGRRSRRARRRRRHLDGGAPRGVRGPDRRADRPPHREPRAAPPSRGSSCRRPTWRLRTRTGSAATSTRGRARSTRTCSSARRLRRRATQTPVEQLWHIGASTHPGPGLGAGSGYLVAKQLTRPPLARRAAREGPGRSRDALAERDLDRRSVASRTTSARTRRPASTGSGSGR